jgi:hypothetical protein
MPIKMMRRVKVFCLIVAPPIERVQACSTGHVHPVNYSSRLLAWYLFYEKCTYDSVYTHAQSYPFLGDNACEQQAYHLLLALMIAQA